LRSWPTPGSPTFVCPPGSEVYVIPVVSSVAVKLIVALPVT
jgi:hypothetical protein